MFSNLNSARTSHGGDWGGKALFSPFEVGKMSERPFRAKCLKLFCHRLLITTVKTAFANSRSLLRREQLSSFQKLCPVKRFYSVGKWLKEKFDPGLLLRAEGPGLSLAKFELPTFHVKIYEN